LSGNGNIAARGLFGGGRFAVRVVTYVVESMIDHRLSHYGDTCGALPNDPREDLSIQVRPKERNAFLSRHLRHE
jgi:hypothetical protein